MDDIAAYFASRPRLYLDTAEILNIADGRVRPDVVQSLDAALWERHIVLVVAIEHMQDALARSEPGTAERVATVLEGFRFRAIVLRDPSHIEPWRGETDDISIAPVPNIREVLSHPKRVPVVNELASAQDALYSSAATFQRAQSDFSDVAFSAEQRSLAGQALAQMVLDRRETDVDAVVDRLAVNLAAPLSTTARDALLAHLRPVQSLIGTFDHDPRFDDAARLSILRSIRDGFGEHPHPRAPGLFLACRLAACRTRDPARQPLRSDSVDGMHAMYFPYVDVATCDKNTHHCLTPYLPKLCGPRHPILIRNGHLDQLLTEIARIPAP